MIQPIVEPTRVDVQAIERELNGLWKRAAEDSAGDQPVMRACTLNLVVCAPDASAAERLTEAILGLTSKHPNRTLMFTLEPEAAQAQLDVWVQANCQFTAPGAAQVCGEQVSVIARGSAVAQTPSLATSLLLPDLPVVLWCPYDAPFSNPLFARLRTLVDRIIVDSAAFSEPDRELHALAALRAEPGPAGQPLAGYGISDLNWTRLTPWRELIAQFFDQRETAQHLYRLDKVEIEVNSEPGAPLNRVPALLLASWLATRLNWLLLAETISVEGDLMRWTLRRPAPLAGPQAVRLVTVEVRPAAQPAQTPGLHAVRLLALDNILASFVVEQTADPGCLRTRAEVAGLPPISRLAHVESGRLDELLAAELRLRGHDDSYEAALAMAGRLVA